MENNYNIIIDLIDFTWDEKKDRKNQKKHGISFEEAKSVFYDENAVLRDDLEHSDDEERFLILGFSEKANMLVVSHCYRQAGDVVRIISARKATKNEKKQYNAFSKR